MKNFGFVLDDIELTAADTANGITYKGWMLFNEDMIWRRKVRHYWGAWKQMDNGNPNVSSGHMLIVKDEVLSYDPEGSVGDRYERLFVKRMLLKEELEEPSQDVCSI